MAANQKTETGIKASFSELQERLKGSKDSFGRLMRKSWILGYVLTVEHVRRHASL